MFIAENWKDYEVLDTGNGEKLERWGSYLLRRPDPQVIWEIRKSSRGWRKPNGHYHRSQRGGGEWEFFELPEQWTISYTLGGDGSSRIPVETAGSYGYSAPENAALSALPAAERTLRFHLKPFSFKHTGLFPEQAANWDWCANLILTERARRVREGNAEPVKVLNLFAYTGGATLAAAKAGAAVTHVDASKGMVQWAKENAESSGLSAAPIRWLVDDCVKFAERELRRGNRYDAIIMDPPSYGRGPKGEIWKLEDDVGGLLKLSAQLLSEKPLFFLLNSYTTGLQPAVMHYLLHSTLCIDRRGRVCAEEVGLPIAANGLMLPCGCSARCSFRSMD